MRYRIRTAHFSVCILKVYNPLSLKCSADAAKQSGLHEVFEAMRQQTAANMMNPSQPQALSNLLLNYRLSTAATRKPRRFCRKSRGKLSFSSACTSTGFFGCGFMDQNETAKVGRKKIDCHDKPGIITQGVIKFATVHILMH